MGEKRSCGKDSWGRTREGTAVDYWGRQAQETFFCGFAGRQLPPGVCMRCLFSLLAQTGAFRSAVLLGRLCFLYFCLLGSPRSTGCCTPLEGGSDVGIQSVAVQLSLSVSCVV